MQQLEQRSDEELLKETRYKSAAQAILGTRAAERMDAEQARVHFRVRDRRGASAGTPAAAAHGGGFAGPRRASSGRPEGRHGEARRHAADQPSAADAARDGHHRAAQERRPAAPDRRHPARAAVHRARDHGRVPDREADRAAVRRRSATRRGSGASCSCSWCSACWRSSDGAGKPLRGPRWPSNARRCTGSARRSNAAADCVGAMRDRLEIAPRTPLTFLGAGPLERVCCHRSGPSSKPTATSCSCTLVA